MVANSIAALTATETQVWPPKARLTTLGPILTPFVMPPAAADTALARPRRSSMRLLSRRGSPGRLASLAQSIASMVG